MPLRMINWQLTLHMYHIVGKHIDKYYSFMILSIPEAHYTEVCWLYNDSIHWLKAARMYSIEALYPEFCHGATIKAEGGQDYYSTRGVTPRRAARCGA